MPVSHQINLTDVLFLTPPFGVYTYRLSDNQIGYETGVRIFVPFGSVRRIGVIVRVYKGQETPKLRDVIEPVDQFPLIPAEIIELTRWIAQYYLCEWGEALAAAVPGALKPSGQPSYKLSETGLSAPLIRDESGPAADLWRMLSQKTLTRTQIRRRFPNGSTLLEQFQRRGWVERSESFAKKKIQSTTVLWKWSGAVSYDEALETLPLKAVKLRQAVEILKTTEGSIDQKTLSRKEKGFSSLMQNLKRKGWVSSTIIPVDRRSIIQSGLGETADGIPELSPAQLNVVNEVKKSISSGSFKSILLHGVTGSGKTLVYLESIAEALSLGLGVIVMVPEISLTPQLTGRLNRRFGERVVVMHSGLSPAERRDVWSMLRNGAARVVVGPRSVVFSPVKNLGLIIIDEEHDDSYKQSDPAPRYHGRDAALYRAFNKRITVLSGSATPDVVTYTNAVQGRCHLMELKERHGSGSQPEVWVVKWAVGSKGECIGPKLKKNLQTCLKRGEQAILLVNRRGFSTVIRCPDCGDVATCVNCDITLRYHRTGQKLVCHYCGFEQRVVDVCPNCKGSRLLYSGIGTQRVERELELLFPAAKIERMDHDTTRRAGAHQAILEGFAQHEFDILIGTQIVAKGHDFPNVTLVGILTADLEWLRPDFRCVEKAYRLLSQASGRTGRAGAGDVIIQAWDPTHQMLRWVQAQDYQKMFDYEIETRRDLSYPPFGDLIALLVRGEDRKAVIEGAGALKEGLMPAMIDCTLLGPVAPPIEKIENLYRQRLLIKLPRRKRLIAKRVKSELRRLVLELRARYKREKLRFIIDVDPVDIS